MLTLPEELLVLALDDNSGCDNLGPELDRALIAAALMDLFLQGCIVRHETVPPIDTPPTVAYRQPSYRISDGATATGNGYLDHVLLTISMHPLSNRLQTIQMLVLQYIDRIEHFRSTPMTELLIANPPNQRLLAAQDLLAREELVHSETLSFWLTRRTHLRRTGRETQAPLLRARLITAINTRPIPNDERLIALLILLSSAQLLKNVFGKDYDAANWRISKLDNPHRRPLFEAGYYAIAGIDLDEYYAHKQFLY